MRGYKSNDPEVYSDILSPLNINLSLGMSYSVNAFNGKLTGSLQMGSYCIQTSDMSDENRLQQDMD